MRIPNSKCCSYKVLKKDYVEALENNLKKQEERYEKIIIKKAEQLMRPGFMNLFGLIKPESKESLIKDLKEENYDSKFLRLLLVDSDLIYYSVVWNKPDYEITEKRKLAIMADQNDDSYIFVTAEEANFVEKNKGNVQNGN